MKSVVVGTAGHIDHGKSALVRALTGTDPDRLKEEKARGITIDLGFAHLSLGDTSFAFVDVPGHERFLKNMLAGVGGIDLVVLVVAADESVMPQTREHFDICRLLRVSRGIVALTKCDLVDRDTLDLVRLEARDLVKGSFLAEAPIVPVSARTSDGLEELRAALVAVAATVTVRSAGGATRLPIDRVFSMKGFGTVVTGTLVAGRIAQDDELWVAPGQRPVKVRGVQVHGVRRTEAVAGERTAVNLGGVNVDDLSRGQTLLQQAAAEQTRVVDATLEVLPGVKPIPHGARVRFHHGTAELFGRVTIVGPFEPRRDGQRTARTLKAGDRAYVRLRLEQPAVLVRGDRFIVRSYSPSHTIAGGLVLDPLPPRIATRSEKAVERWRRLDPETIDASGLPSALKASALFIEESGLRGLPVDRLISRVGVEPGRVAEHVAAMMASGTAVEVDRHLVAPMLVARLKTQLVAALADHHRRDPLSEGIAREEARVRLCGRGHAAVFERAVEELSAHGVIVARDRLALATHHVELSPDAERARVAIDRMFREAGLCPPDAASVVAGSGAPAAVVDQVIRILQRQKVLVKVDTLLFHDEALQELKRAVAALKEAMVGQAKLDVPAFKARFGVTRKFAIPLLEYLDRERVTRRVGDTRLIL